MAADIWSTQRTLSVTLGAWGVGSVVIGELLRRRGRGSGDDTLIGLGRQQSGWGAIDAAIAGVGAWRGWRGAVDRADPVLAEAERLKLHRVLRFNAGLDLLYLAGAAVLIGGAEPLSRRIPASASMLRGDGLGIAVQGGFLLMLDTAFAAITAGGQPAVTASQSNPPAVAH